jgi:uncharacterized protein YcfJ
MKTFSPHAFRALGSGLVGCLLLTFTSCETQTQKGALIGGLGGAAIGGIAGNGKGALIGGAIGAATGAVIGNNKDRRQGNYGRGYNDRASYNNRNGYRQSSYGRDPRYNRGGYRF